MRPTATKLTVGLTAIVLVAGFLVAPVTGVVGASNPLSGPVSLPVGGSITSPSTAAALAAALGAPATSLVSASLGTSDPMGTGIGEGPLGPFPRDGSSFAILSSGAASSADDPDTNNDEALGVGGAADDVTYILEGLNNSQGQDLVQLSLILNVPNKFRCFAFDLAFYTEEWPDFIASQFNDTFITEVGPPGSASTFTIEGTDVVAPNNIAFDINGATLEVNSAYGFDPAIPNPNTGTTYDGTSGLLTARTQVTPGTQIEVVFSIMDLGDSILDSAVFLDHFRWTTDPPELCEPGAQPVGQKFVVFVQGLGTSLATSVPEGAESTFDDIKTELSWEAGYRPSDFLEYSYEGGEVAEGGQWRPKEYGCAATAQSIDASALLLKDMILAMREHDENARFVIVGHSLGGVVALRLLNYVVNGVIAPGAVEAVVTLDSPLSGVSLSNTIKGLLPFPAVSCGVLDTLGLLALIDEPAGNELDDMAANPKVPANNKKLVADAMAKSPGLRVVTLGNAQDCLYDLKECGVPRPDKAIGGQWPGETLTQVVGNPATKKLWRLGGNCDFQLADLMTFAQCLRDSHHAILHNRLSDTVGYVGPRARP